MLSKKAIGLFCFEEELTSKWGFIRNNINNKENTMLWKGRRGSSNVEDRRGRSAKVMVGGGIGTIVLVLTIYLLGGDPTQLLNNSQLNDSQVF